MKQRLKYPHPRQSGRTEQLMEQVVVTNKIRKKLMAKYKDWTLLDEYYLNNGNIHWTSSIRKGLETCLIYDDDGFVTKSFILTDMVALFIGQLLNADIKGFRVPKGHDQQLIEILDKHKSLVKVSCPNEVGYTEYRNL